MTTETNSDKNDGQKSDNLLFLLGKQWEALNQRSQAWADRLHKARNIYALYGLLDGFSISYSTLKYYFDILCTNTDVASADALHEWLMTPWGVVFGISESLSIILFSILGNFFDDDDKNNIKKYIAYLWPFIRDILKGLKNSFKAVRSMLQLSSVISGQHLIFLTIPISLTIGVIAVANRVWYRNMKNRRIAMMRENEALRDEIIASPELSLDECANLRKKIQRQTTQTQWIALISSFYSGIVDSAYLYLGILLLGTFNLPGLVILTTLCVIYSISYIIANIYTEYDYQQKLAVTQTEIELELLGREFDILSRETPRSLATKSDELTGLNEQKASLNRKLELIIYKNCRLQSFKTLSSPLAFLSGMKDGLAAYGALTSVIFTIAMVLVLSSTTFPPILVITTVATGIVFLFGFISYSLVTHSRHREKQLLKTNKPHSEQKDIMLEKIKNRTLTQSSDSTNNNPPKRIVDNLSIHDQPPQFYFQEWFEVIRAGMSGLRKGPNSVDFALNPLLKADEQGHYQDTPVVLGVGLITALVSGFTMAVRAHTKAFKPNSSAQKFDEKSNLTKTLVSTNDGEFLIKDVSCNQKVDTDKPPGTLSNTYLFSLLPRFSIFKPIQPTVSQQNVSINHASLVPDA